MALLTPLSPSDAQILLESYGLDLVELTPLAAGSVNSNFFICARRRDNLSEGALLRFFARIYEEQGDVGATFELMLNEALHQANIPVARPVRRSDGSLFGSHSGKPFAVYERLSGEVLCQKMVTSERAFSVGAALGRVHTAPLGDLQVGPSRFDFDGILERLVRVRESGRKDLLPAVERLEVLVRNLRTERRGDLPQGLIHGDLFRDNVLIEGDQVIGLLDFESASRGPFVFDLMVTLLAWCFGAKLEHGLVRAMVEGYISVRPLLKSEKEAMVIEGSVACARFATTRLTDFSLRVREGEKPGRDYERFFRRLHALEAGELGAALSGIF